MQTLKTDPVLAARIKAEPGLRVPGCWNGFELAVRAILGQQVSVKGATTLAGRLVKTFGQPFTAAAGLTHVFPQPKRSGRRELRRHRPAASASRKQSGRLARAVCDGRINFDGVVDSTEFLSRFVKFPASASGRRNTSPCALWASLMPFLRRTWDCCARCVCKARVSWSGSPRPGGLGDPTPPSTFGISRALRKLADERTRSSLFGAPLRDARNTGMTEA